MDIIKAYEILGLKYGVSDALLKSTYHNLCKELHPDTPGTTEVDHERYMQVVSAYEFIVRYKSVMSTVTVPVYSGRVVGNPVKTEHKTGGRVIGRRSVSGRPGTTENKAARQKFEKQMEQSRNERRKASAAELEKRREELEKQKAREKQILNEIRMIRLAHLIHDALAEDMNVKKEGS